LVFIASDPPGRVAPEAMNAPDSPRLTKPRSSSMYSGRWREGVVAHQVIDVFVFKAGAGEGFGA